MSKKSALGLRAVLLVIWLVAAMTLLLTGGTTFLRVTSTFQLVVILVLGVLLLLELKSR